MDPAEERRVTHLDRHIEHLVEREEDRNLDQDRPAARQRIDLLLLVELHHLLLLLHPVVRIFFADFHHLGLHLLHVGHRLVGLVGQREEDQLDDDRGREDSEAEIAEKLEQPVDEMEHRLGDEVEPAPVDQKLELADVARLLIGVDHPDLLGAGEDQRLNRLRGARRDDRRVGQIVGLIAHRRLAEIREARLETLAGLRNQRHGPVFVGDAEPAVARLRRRDVAVVLEVRIVDFLQALGAGHADQAFMQDVDAARLRLADPVDPAVIGDRCRRGTLVGDLVRQREHVVLVDRNRALEGQPGSVVVGQRHRGRWRQRGAFGRGPHRVVVGQVAVADIADLGIEAGRHRRRIEKLDVGRTLVDRDVVVLEQQVVDARTRQIDRAGEPGRVDPDALVEGKLGGAVALDLGSSRSAGYALAIAGLAGKFGRRRRSVALRVGGRSGCGISRLLGRDPFLFDARIDVENLPDGQDQHRKRDRDEEIPVVIHGSFRESAGRVLLSARRTAP